MAKRRYPGVTPFSADQKTIFCGRKDDINKLTKLILLRDQVLLYAESGLGKTSLLNAGILPFIPNNIIQIPIRFFAYDEEDKENSVSPVNTAVSGLRDAVKESECIQKIIKRSGYEGKTQISFEELEDTLLDKIISGESYDKTLWYYFKKIQQCSLSKNPLQKEPLQFLLIFDQFEELFTYPKLLVNQFRDQLYELTRIDVPDEIVQLIQKKPEIEDSPEIDMLYEDLHIKTIYAIRSDRLDKLNILSDKIPDIQRVYHELKPLDENQAHQAITQPAAKSTKDLLFDSPLFEFHPLAVDALIDELSSNGKQDIETTQLQIVCQKIEDIAKQKSELETEGKPVIITKDDLPDFKDIFLHFYNDSISKTDQPEDASRFIENYLIKKGQRISLDERILPPDISHKTLDILVDTHLLRRVPNTVGGVSYELSHDTLIKPIIDIKHTRVLKEEKEATRLAEIEREKIEKQIALKKKRKRIVVAAIVITYVILSIGFGYFMWKSEKKAIDYAETAKIYAETAKSNEMKAIAEKQRADSSEQIAIANALEAIAEKQRADSSEQIAIANANAAKDNARKAKANEKKAIAEKQRADTNERIANDRLIQIKKDDTIKKMDFGNGFLDKALFELDEKNYNAAKIYALNALEYKNFLDDETKAQATDILNLNEYPVEIFDTINYLKMQTVAISKNERYIATCGNNYNVIVLWDTKRENRIQLLSGHTNKINCLDFSPDNKYLASGSDDGTIRIWDLAKNLIEGTILKGQNKYSGNIISVQYNYNGNYFAALSDKYYTSNIYLFDMTNLKITKTIKNVQASANNMIFSNNGNLLAYAGQDNTVFLWSKERNKRKKIGGHSDKINCLSFSHDSKLLASGSDDNKVVITDIEKETRITLEEHNSNVTCVMFSPRSYQLVSGDDESTIKIWDVKYPFYDKFGLTSPDSKSKKISSVATLKNHFNQIASLKFINGGRKLLTLAADERNLKKWTMKSRPTTSNENNPDLSNENNLANAEKKFNLTISNSKIKIRRTAIDSLFTLAESSTSDSIRAVYYREILNINPDGLDAIYGLALSSLLSSNNEEAEETFLKYLQIIPRDNLVWNYLGNAYFRQKKYDKAIESYDKSIEINSSYEWPWLNKGYTYYEKGKPDSAIYCYERTNEINTYAENLHNYFGLAYYNKGNYNAAIRSFNREINNNPYNKYAYYNLGFSYRITGDTAKSFEYFKKSLDIDPNYKQAFNELALLESEQKYQRLIEANDHFENEEYEKAEEIFDELYLSYPNEESIKEGYTKTLVKMGEKTIREQNYTKAYRYYEKVWQVNPDYITSYDWRDVGDNFYSQDSCKEAIEFYRHSIFKDATNESTWVDLGNSYLCNRDTAGAIDAYNKSVNIYPDYSYALNNLGFVYSQKKEYKRAIELFNKVLKKNPSNDYALRRMADIYYELEKYELSIQYAEKTIKYYPESANNWGSLSWYYLFNFQYKETLDASIKGYEIDTTQKWILTNKGHAFLFLGKKEEAFDVYRSIKDIISNGEPLSEALLRDFTDFEDAGIRNKEFDTARAFLEER